MEFGNNVFCGRLCSLLYSPCCRTEGRSSKNMHCKVFWAWRILGVIEGNVADEESPNPDLVTLQCARPRYGAIQVTMATSFKPSNIWKCVSRLGGKYGIVISSFKSMFLDVNFAFEIWWYGCRILHTCPFSAIVGGARGRFSGRRATELQH